MRKHKSNNKNKKLIWLILASVLVISSVLVILFIVYGHPQTQFPYGVSVSATRTDSNPITYDVRVINQNPTKVAGGCNANADTNLFTAVAYNNVADGLVGLNNSYNYNVTGGSIDFLGGSIPIVGGSCYYDTQRLICTPLAQSAVYGCYINSYEFTVVATLPLQISTQTTNNTVQNQSVIVNNPPQTIQPSGWNLFWLNAGKFISDLWSAIKTAILPQTIYGPAVINPGQTYTYNISISAPNTPDTNYKDGTYNEQFGSWKILDENNNTIQQANPLYVPINQTYNTQVTFTAPSSSASYALIAIVDEIDYTYNYSSASWNHTESIVKEEGYNMQTEASAPVIVSPTAWTLFWNNIGTFFSNIWHKIIG